MKSFSARLVDALVVVRAEVVALALEQIGGHPLPAVAVDVPERRGQTRGTGTPCSTAALTTARNAAVAGSLDDPAEGLPPPAG